MIVVGWFRRVLFRSLGSGVLCAMAGAVLAVGIVVPIISRPQPVVVDNLLAAALDAPHDGDTIDPTGTFTVPPPKISKRVLIQSTIDATWDMAGVSEGWAGGGKGVFVATADQVGPDEGFGAFRADDNCSAMTVSGCTMRGNSNGLKGSANPCLIHSEGNTYDGNGDGRSGNHHVYTFDYNFLTSTNDTFLNCTGTHDIPANLRRQPLYPPTAVSCPGPYERLNCERTPNRAPLRANFSQFGLKLRE